MITVNLGKFNFIKSIPNLTWKYLMKPSVLLNFVYRRDIPRLSDALQLLHKIVCCQETVANKIEALCILLKRLSYPCRFSDMVPFFGRNLTEVCLIFNYVLDYIYNRVNHLLSFWNQDILQPDKLALYCNVIPQKTASLQNCCRFDDGNVLRISCPKVNQNIVYNGHKRGHGIKFQSLSNGLIGNLNGSYMGKRHDSIMLHESGLLTN